MKTTKWYPVAINPARVGWYEADYDGCGTCMRWFDGYMWRSGPGSEMVITFGCCPGDKWRGLTEKAA